MVFSLLLCIVNNNNNNNNILYKVYSILASYNGYIFTILISFCYSLLSYVFSLYVYGYTVQYSNNILSSFIQCNNAGLHSEFPPSPSSPFPHPPPLPSPSPSHLYSPHPLVTHLSKFAGFFKRELLYGNLYLGGMILKLRLCCLRGKMY